METCCGPRLRNTAERSDSAQMGVELRYRYVDRPRERRVCGIGPVDMKEPSLQKILIRVAGTGVVDLIVSVSQEKAGARGWWRRTVYGGRDESIEAECQRRCREALRSCGQATEHL